MARRIFAQGVVDRYTLEHLPIEGRLTPKVLQVRRNTRSIHELKTLEAMRAVLSGNLKLAARGIRDRIGQKRTPDFLARSGYNDASLAVLLSPSTRLGWGTMIKLPQALVAYCVDERITVTTEEWKLLFPLLALAALWDGFSSGAKHSPEMEEILNVMVITGKQITDLNTRRRILEMSARLLAELQCANELGSEFYDRYVESAAAILLNLTYQRIKFDEQNFGTVGVRKASAERQPRPNASIPTKAWRLFEDRVLLGGEYLANLLSDPYSVTFYDEEIGGKAK